MSKNIDTVKGIYAAFGRGDLPALLDAVSDDVSWGIESVATAEVPAYGIRNGKDGVAKFAAAWGEIGEFVKFEADDFVAAGDHVFCTLRIELAVRATGKRVKNASAQHWTLRDGKVIRWRGWEDTAATRDACRR